MTAVAQTPPRHVVSRAVAAAQSKVAEVSGASLWSLSPGETSEALVELGRLGAMVAELELRVAEHAHGLQVGEGRGATSTASWWAHATRQVRPVAHRKMRLALALGRYERLRAALAGGAVLLEQAYVIAEALEALPGDLPVETRGEAEAGLVRFAGRARRAGAADPGPADPRRGGPGGRGGGRGGAPGRGGARRGGADAVHDGRGRSRGACGAGSRCRSRWARCCARRCWRWRRPATSPRPTAPWGSGVRPRSDGRGVRAVRRAVPRRAVAGGGWGGRHGGGDDGAGDVAGWSGGGVVGHRGADQCRHGAALGVRGGDHPGGPGWGLAGAGPGPAAAFPHRGPADRVGPRGGRLHRAGL